VEGVHRFLARAWRLFEGGLSGGAPSAEQLRQLHSTIKRVRRPPCAPAIASRLFGQPRLRRKQSFLLPAVAA
jgi:hypothetical protein